MNIPAWNSSSQIDASWPLDADELREAERLLEERITSLEKADPNAYSHRYHIRRYLTTLAFLPKVEADVLDLGGALGLFSELLTRFRRYRIHLADSAAAPRTRNFDFDRDPFPYRDGQFDIVLFMEVLEHLREDPMHAMFEINRIVRPGGCLMLTTPNIASWKSIRRALNHENPALFAPYLRFGGTDRHNREYTHREVVRLLADAGFELERGRTIDIYPHVPGGEPIPGFDSSDRGDTSFCLARKVGPGVSRKPEWLYWPAG